MLSPAEQIRVEACDVNGAPIEDLTERVFREVLASPGFEVRETQIAMARAVARTLNGDVEAQQPVYVAEGPCGSGKGMSYLVPVVLTLLRTRLGHSRPNARIVISTSHIGLQRQLVRKDIPLLESKLGNRITAAVLKSRSNYVCPDKLDSMLVQRSHKDIAFFDRVSSWLLRGGSGDREDIPLQLGPEWGDVSVDGGGCIGSKCPVISRCPSHKARIEGMTASVLVVNHAYLAASLGSMMTEPSVVGLVVDEAHDIEDALRRSSGIELHEGKSSSWQRKLDAVGLQQLGYDIAESIRILVHNGAAVLGNNDEVRLQDGWIPDADSARVTDLMADVLTDLERAANNEVDDLKAARIGVLCEQVARLWGKMTGLLVPGTKSFAWVERASSSRPRVELHRAPIQVALPQHLPTVLTSATIGDPTLLASDVGLKPTEVDAFPSPWPLQDMGVVVVPTGAPSPLSPAWRGWATRKVVEFVTACGGGVLVLSTTRSAMATFRDALDRAGFNVKAQGDQGRTELINWFTSQPDSVLVATRSFFQGIDVPGDALRGVVIDKIPFPSPTLLENAICDRLKAEGLDPFRVRAMTKAKTALKQAAGRLLRASTDRGAVLILDGRMLTANYGASFQRALLPMPFSADLADVERVLRGEAPQNTRHVSRGRRGIRV